MERALEVNRVYLEGFENGHFQINKLLKNGLETCTYNKCVREEGKIAIFTSSLPMGPRARLN